ncbi:Purine nucleoside phosphorylase DeoD-type [[Clostridium] ultunense Esp]|uniref:Uridine phosphorylase n=1 Tax=[Clostridium] ultunense Esp TaxID=1288971 RepID=M1ZF59_9FIRM|nr:purine-nucleoside phosphorylase [Schnuerera ultunensis]CCQ96979.1 Purine nucleoside phosphorylase DeoD-type [[Clostridium] ultunense Esp]SHD76464.1 Purine nucleoside phosphorylase DeoD-type [[Clostridium] ultunense Esp]
MRNKIPTPHIEATSKEEIANTVLMPGDPLRAKFIAETYLDNFNQFNKVRGMLGYTGFYNGKRVSVMGSGMGIPSALIYYYELFKLYDVETIIRIGTAGSLQPHIRLKDVILATTSSTDSSITRGEFGRFNYCPTPDFNLLLSAYKKSEQMGITAHAGMVVCGDQFYDTRSSQEVIQKFREYGAIAADMESAGLYTVANRLGKKSLAMFTISDDENTNSSDTPKMREQGYTQMMELALEIAPE